MSEHESGSQEDPKLLFAKMDAEEQASRLALAGEPDPISYDARVAEAYRLRSEAPGTPTPELSPAASAELDRHVDGLVRQWQEKPSYNERLKEAAARMANKSPDKDRAR